MGAFTPIADHEPLPSPRARGEGQGEGPTKHYGRSHMKSIKIAASVFLFLFLKLDIAAAQKQIAPQDSPVALFQQIYGAYPDTEAASAWHKADKNWGPSGDDKQVPGFETLPLSGATAALNQRVNKKLEKDGFVCIDYDMISDSQDPDIARYRIVTPAKGGAQYEVYFEGKSRKGATRVSYLLAQEDGAWRIDDIYTYSKSKGKVVRNGARVMLQDCLKN